MIIGNLGNNLSLLTAKNRWVVGDIGSFDTEMAFVR